MALDSKALFASMVKAVGLAEFAEGFAENGIDMVATFAFAGSYTPGAKDDERFVMEAIIPIL
eukprot:6908697-Karenia_brevis.AAC.1